MKIILYKDTEILETIEGAENVIVKGNNIQCSKGTWGGVQVPFLILDDNVEVTEITQDIIAQDKKSECIDETEQRISLLEQAMNYLILGGM